MRRPRQALLGVVGLVGVGLLACGCGPSARDIAEARSRYVAALDGFVVRQEPVPRLRQDVELGLIVRRDETEDDRGEGLPGITLDVDQVDVAGKSRRHWRVWVDTAGLVPGRELRTEQVLQDVDYVPGDGFRVEVRRDVPAGERAAYREWGGSTSSGPTS
jgi:hypothetical protein